MPFLPKVLKTLDKLRSITLHDKKDDTHEELVLRGGKMQACLKIQNDFEEKIYTNLQISSNI